MELTIDYDTSEGDADEKIHYLGILANVNADISKVQLDRGFKIVAMPTEAAINLWADLEGIPRESNFFRLEKRSLSKDDHLYVINNVFESWVTTCGEYNEGVVLDDAYNDAARVNLYLHPKLQLIRLFTAKNVFMPFEYYYIVENGKPSLRRKSSTQSRVDFRPKFSLMDEEMPKLQEFIEKTLLPFKIRFLELAFLHFEASFQTNRAEQAFLSLMTCLEILLQPPPSGKSFFLGKNCAILMGVDEQNRRRLEEEIREFYKYRNLLVHEGVFVRFNESELGSVPNTVSLARLRDIVASLIRKVYSLGLDKKELLAMFRQPRTA